MSKFAMLIDGQLVETDQSIGVENPATGLEFAVAPRAERGHLDMAVTAARNAFAGWRGRPVAERCDILRQMGAKLRHHIDELAALLVSEQGKPMASARIEILVAAMWCDAASDWTLPIHVTEDNPERRSETIRTPLGVVGAIVPWNFPIGLAFWKIVPALFTGNCVVVKPAPTTPLTTLAIGRLLADIVPPGVLNIISGGDDLGPQMTTHPEIDKISFTGSTQTGRKVMASAAHTLKRLTLELGGNDPAIILPDVDIAETAEAVFWAAFRNSGQFCIAAKRIYVHASIYAEFANALNRVAASKVVGPGTLPEAELGPVQNRLQFERVKGLVDRTRNAGHRFICGGTVPEAPGYFIPVTIVDNPPDDAEVVTEEAFGPVVPLLKFDTIEEAVRRANDSPYGLAASIWTKDDAAAARIAAELECGTVWVNEAHHLSPDTPFGGHKQSGIGVENGAEGLLEFTNAKTVSMRRVKAG